MDKIVASIAAHAAEFRECGATGVYLYGSQARGEARPDSDIDLFIDYDSSSQIPDLFQLMAIERRLSHETGSPVSITTRNALHPLMKDDIERDAIRLM